MKKIISYVLVIVLTMTLCGAMTTTSAYAKSSKSVLSRKKVQLKVGKTVKIKLKKANKKVKWKVADKSVVKIVKKSGKKNNTIKIKGVKAGKTKITAKCNKKKYVVKVTVKKNTKEVVTTKPEETVTATENFEKETTTVKVETTTPEAETTIEATEKPTGEQTTVAPGKFVAELVDDVVTANDGISIKCYFDGPSDLVIAMDYIPEKLQQYRNGQWVEIPLREDYENIDGIVGIDSSRTWTYGVPLEAAYGELEVGHYRYLQSVGTHYTNTSNQEFEKCIPLEFNVVNPGECSHITASVENEKIEMDEDLVINYTIDAENENAVTYYNKHPGKLEYYSYGTWRMVAFNDEYEKHFCADSAVVGDCTLELTVDIDDIYGELRSGRYRYTTVVGNYEIPVEFELLNVSSEVVGVVENDTITLDENLEIKYMAVDGVSMYSYFLYPGVLEIYENGVWTEMEISGDCPPVEEIICSTNGGMWDGYYSLPIVECYKDVRVGHYRYWHEVGNKMVPVEFDVVYGNKDFKLMAAIDAESNDIQMLNMKVTILKKDENFIPSYGYEPKAVERYEDGQWKSVSYSYRFKGYPEIALSITENEAEISIDPLDYIMIKGHYRWIHTVGGVDVKVEFDII